MTETTRCSVCGCTQFRLDRRRNQILCLVCGTSQTAQADLARQQSYLNAKRMAVTHVRRGAYSQALPFLAEMMRAQPDDPDLYYLHLMGLTDFFKDPLVPGDDRLKQASEHYRSYRGLGGQTGQFRSYGLKRRQALEQLIRRKTWAMWGGIALRLLALAASFLLLWDSWLFWTVFFLLVFWLIWSLLSWEDPLDIREIRRLRRCLQSARRSEDPFFYV